MRRIDKWEIRLHHAPRTLKAGYEKQTHAFIRSEGRVRVFSAKCPQQSPGANAASHAAMLQSLRFLLSVITYMGWNFGVMDSSRAFLESEPLE